MRIAHTQYKYSKMLRKNILGAIIMYSDRLIQLACSHFLPHNDQYLFKSWLFIYSFASPRLKS